ncbi:leucine-rich repeat domain-containing protein [Microcoleus sp. w1-18aA5]|uniref:leucine-rich repeat domain-containing protein n=1 Tax=Microcoleus sp. w1-18aA5 TaxID=2818982 RepID=UPI002FD396E5
MMREEAVRRIEWAAEKKLKKLDLSRLNLKKLPPEIAKCTQLETLLLAKWDDEVVDLFGNKLTEFPNAVFELTNLKILNLRGSRIPSIPEAVRQLSNLTELNLSCNQITSIPEAVGQLSNLTELDLSCNQITSIPEWLGQLSNLKSFSLSFNQITSIPEWLGQLSNLKSFFLSSNQITSIPEAVGQLPNLKNLSLDGNQITSIPEVIGQLSNLEWLFLSFNQITSIPEAIGQLSNLQGLFLNNNQITEIPEAIRSMKNLKKLDLQGNPLPIPLQVLGDGQNYEWSGDWLTMLDSYFNIRNAALPELDAERQKIKSEGYFDAETLQDARRRITASIVQRQGQPEFRRKLLIAYGGRCPITDCDVESAIEAAHIIPYKGTQTNHLTNGLPLRADIHTLFDLHLLSIRPDTNEVVIAPALVGTCYQDLADRKLTLPQDKKTAPSQNALSKHHETFLSKCKNDQLKRL